jgi:hypothetical protein
VVSNSEEVLHDAAASPENNEKMKDRRVEVEKMRR